MTNKKIVLYIYDIDTQEINAHLDMILERQTVDAGSQNEQEKVCAVNPSKKQRYEISDKSGTVFYDHDSHTYHIWFDEPNFDGAVSAIGNYIFNNIDQAMFDTQELLDSQNNEKIESINLLNYIK